MDRTFLNKRIVFLSTPSQTVRLEYCPVCKIETNHKQTPDGWKCRVCDTAIDPQAERLDRISYELATGRADLTDGLVEEIAELLDGSATDWNTQLLDAGFGTGGIL